MREEGRGRKYLEVWKRRRKENERKRMNERRGKD